MNDCCQHGSHGDTEICILISREFDHDWSLPPWERRRRRTPLKHDPIITIRRRNLMKASRSAASSNSCLRCRRRGASESNREATPVHQPLTECCT